MNAIFYLIMYCGNPHLLNKIKSWIISTRDTPFAANPVNIMLLVHFDAKDKLQYFKTCTTTPFKKQPTKACQEQVCWRQDVICPLFSAALPFPPELVAVTIINTISIYYTNACSTITISIHIDNTTLTQYQLFIFHVHANPWTSMMIWLCIILCCWYTIV